MTKILFTMALLSACASFKYGINCTELCGNCLNGDACQLETGSCTSGCEPGYTGEHCTDGGLHTACVNLRNDEMIQC